ncbi:GNAT family N-acetyltransferase [Cohnella panacarvi]|uniref:GNAT family N-acetyltransferase n=1 Tax=Cohnella panacarvi TaxID=400776 RepID=UPI00047C552A|nr:GNAT family N-acetyltransferase [Cohnella panacarvi]
MSVILDYRLLKPEEWESGRFQLLRFVRRHGERRITALAWQKLLLVSEAELAQPGTAIAVAYTQGGCPAGVAFAVQFGESACLVTVHPALRGRGVGRKLLGVLAEPWGRLTCNVAIDNAASVAMCFAAGLVAVGLETGPTGKPTLRFVRSSQEDGNAQTDDRSISDVVFGHRADDDTQALPATPARR